MKDNPAKTLELSREDFIQKVKGYSEALEHDQEARRKFTLQAGSLEKARAFIKRVLALVNWQSWPICRLPPCGTTSAWAW